MTLSIKRKDADIDAQWRTVKQVTDNLSPLDTAFEQGALATFNWLFVDSAAPPSLMRVAHDIRVGSTPVAPTTAGPTLIDLPVTRACIEKWNAGRAKHGEMFEGDALKELYAELIDGINYCDQAAMQDIDVGHVQSELYNLANDVREIYLERKEDIHV